LNVNTVNATNVAVKLTGTGVVPVYTLTPGPGSSGGHDFGNQQVNTQSGPFQLTLTNTVASLGGELWLIGNPVVTGNISNASQFQAAFRTGDTCTTATHLATGASCTFSVVFAPTSTGSKGTSATSQGVARVDVTHVAGAVNAGLIGSPVWGTGVAPTATRSPTALGFGNVLANVSSTSLPVTLSNSGSGPLAFTNITFTGTNNANFTQTSNCPSILAVGANCVIYVTFTPSSTGIRNVTMNINDAAGTQTVALTGTGVPAATVRFTWNNGGTVGAWGTATGSRIITVTNTGNAGSQLSLSAVPAVSNLTGGTQFVRSAGTCSAATVLVSNGTCTVEITRTRPTSGNTAGTGTLTVTDTGAAAAAQSLSLSGS
jgi:hypothetical protein